MISGWWLRFAYAVKVYTATLSQKRVMLLFGQVCFLLWKFLAILVILFSSYSPFPPTHRPLPPTPLPRSRFGVVFQLFSSRFRVDFELRLENDRKAIRNRPKNDSKSTPREGGQWWWSMSWGKWAVAGKQCHHAILPALQNIASDCCCDAVVRSAQNPRLRCVRSTVQSDL